MKEPTPLPYPVVVFFKNLLDDSSQIPLSRRLERTSLRTQIAPLLELSP